MNGNISGALLYSMEKRKLIEKRKEIKPGKTKAMTESYISLSGDLFSFRQNFEVAGKGYRLS